MTDVHSFHRPDPTRGFLLYAVHYLLCLTSTHRYEIEAWEYVAVVGTAWHCLARRGGEGREVPTASGRPSMRCITIGNWYQVSGGGCTTISSFQSVS